MSALVSKVCVVGDFCVGKTSVVERFVNNQFSDKYLTTIGVKVDTKEVELSSRGITIKLVIWDVAGADRFGEKEFAYLRGTDGLIYVADGTRPSTFDSLNTLISQIQTRIGDRPGVLLMNKNDLIGQWKVTQEIKDKFSALVGATYSTSAKTGEGVEDALTNLGEQIVAGQLS
ncbi:MAG: Rab family GTPase [Pseudomonadota bacterium]